MSKIRLPNKKITKKSKAKAKLRLSDLASHKALHKPQVEQGEYSLTIEDGGLMEQHIKDYLAALERDTSMTNERKTAIKEHINQFVAFVHSREAARIAQAEKPEEDPPETDPPEAKSYGKQRRS